MFSERFGRGSRTVDLELEAQIEVLRDTKSKYENILRLANALINHFQSMVQTQQALGDTFTDLSQKSPELQVEHHKEWFSVSWIKRNTADKSCNVLLFFSYCRTSLDTTQKHRSCCVKTARLCSAPSASLCPAWTPWWTRPWRTLWWPSNTMRTRGNPQQSLRISMFDV